MGIPGASYAGESVSKEIDDLPDDAIVCYMFGQPVYKSEVDENLFVQRDFNIDNGNFNTSDFNIANNHSGGYEESYVPIRHRSKNIIAEGQLSSIQFGQNEKWLYLTKDSAQQYASAAESSGSNVNILSLLMSAAALWQNVPPLVAISALIAGLSSYNRSKFASDIRNYTDNGSGVIVVQINNMYGKFTAVHAWDGLNVIRYGTSGSSYTTSVIGVATECGVYPWSGTGGGGDVHLPWSIVTPQHQQLGVVEIMR